MYFNGSKRRSGSLYGSSLSSASSSDERPKDKDKENHLGESSSDASNKKKKVNAKRVSAHTKAAERRQKRLSSLQIKGDTSSEEDTTAKTKKEWPKSRLTEFEEQLGKFSASDSDELIPIGKIFYIFLFKGW